MSKSFILLVTMILAVIMTTMVTSEIYTSVLNLNAVSESAMMTINFGGDNFQVAEEVYDVEIAFEGVKINPTQQYFNLIRVEINMDTQENITTFKNITIPHTSDNKIILKDISFQKMVNPSWYFGATIIGYLHASPLSTSKPASFTVTVICKTQQKTETSDITAIPLLKVAGEKLNVIRDDHVDPQTKQHYDTFSFTVDRPNQDMKNKVEFLNFADFTPFGAGVMRLIDPKSRSTGCTVNGEAVDAAISPFDEDRSLVFTGAVIDKLLTKHPNEWVVKCSNVGVYRSHFEPKEEHLFYIYAVPSGVDEDQTWSVDKWVF